MVIFTLIGALIGAGFASGQEIYLFFYRYGINGIFGIFVCSLLVGTTIYKTFLIIYRKNITNYREFLETILKNKKNVKIINWIINIFLIASFYIMISGFGAYFEQEFEINHIIGVLILAIVSFLVLLKDVSRVAKISRIVVPVLIFCIIVIGIKNIMQINFENFINKTIKREGGELWWLIQSIIYCSYNMILVIPVIINLKRYIKNEKHIIYVSICTGIIIFILAISIFLLLINVDINFRMLDMPAVYVISKFFPQYKLIYGIVILLSIFTSAISIGISILENIAKNKKSFPQIAFFLCITSVVISNFGFSNLVKFLFPLFGYLGVLQIINIINLLLP